MSNIEESTLHSARLFADKYLAAESEKQLGQSFWRDFFTSVAGINDLLSSGIEFEFPVRSKTGTINFIDVFWSGVVLIEQKSAGKSLDEAEKQARDYLIALQPELRPPTIIVSDFKRIRIIEVLAGQTHEFELKNLPENLQRMEMVIGQNAKEATRQEITADQKAYELYKIEYAFKIINVIIPIGILYLYRNYIAFLLIQILLTFVFNIVVYLKVKNSFFNKFILKFFCM
jgi:hypothetical protein